MTDATKSVFTHNDGTTQRLCVVCETRNGRLVARYDLPDDPQMRSLRDWFDERLYKRLDEFFAKRVKEIEADIFAWIKRNPICYMNPCRAILDGICGCITPAIYPHCNVLAERYDVAEFFIQFPLGLPTELKGVAV